MKPDHLDDVFDDPTLLTGKTPGEIEGFARNNPRWQVNTLGKGSHKGQGLIIRELTSDGNNFTDRIIQWHPGGGRHGAQPYWKVSSGKGGTARIGPQFKI